MLTLRNYRRFIFLLVLLAGLLAMANRSAMAQQAADAQTTHIFFSAGCADCWPYTEDSLIPALQAQGVTSEAEIHDYTAPEGRAALGELSEAIALPTTIADSLYAFVPTGAGTLLILGHVPPRLVEAALTASDLPPRLLLWQPLMHGEPTEYRLWAWSGDVQSFPIDTPFAAALARSETAVGPLPLERANLRGLLPAVIVTGLLDSVNPCAFAVVLLLIAFLFTLRKSRSQVLKLGFFYVAMIFLVYFAIGLGLLRTVRLSDDPHLVARAGSWLLIGLGVLNLIEYFFPAFPIKLHMPAIAGERANALIRRATVPATVAAGFLVGLCTFPCSGGIYVSIITLLNAKTTAAWGVSYLLLYNLLFVLPLAAILLAVGSRPAAKSLARWERVHALRIRLWYGLSMVALGAIMLIWFLN